MLPAQYIFNYVACYALTLTSPCLMANEDLDSRFYLYSARNYTSKSSEVQHFKYGKKSWSPKQNMYIIAIVNYLQGGRIIAEC